MTDKEKIKEEIEKQIDYAEDDTRYTESYREGLIAAYQTIKAFIDSLPEESASEDLEEEIDKIWKTCNPIDEGMGVETANIHIEQFDDITKHFAEWGRNHFEDKSEMVSEDLEEAATKWNETAFFQPFYMQLDCNGNPCEVKQDITTHKESFKAGAEWRKQQMKETLQTEYEKGRFDMREEMMKDAVEDCSVIFLSDNKNWLQIPGANLVKALESFKQGDKVKIIIIKAEQQ